MTHNKNIQACCKKLFVVVKMTVSICVKRKLLIRSYEVELNEAEDETGQLSKFNKKSFYHFYGQTPSSRGLQHLLAYQRHAFACKDFLIL